MQEQRGGALALLAAANLAAADAPGTESTAVAPATSPAIAVAHTAAVAVPPAGAPCAEPESTAASCRTCLPARRRHGGHAYRL